MLSQLQELDLRHIHEGVDLVFRAFEVFNAERVYGNDFDPGLVADFEDLNVSKLAKCCRFLSPGILCYFC